MADSAHSDEGSTADRRARKASRPVQVQVLFDALVGAELASLRVADLLNRVQSRLGTDGLPKAPVRAGTATTTPTEDGEWDAAPGGRIEGRELDTSPIRLVEFPWFDLPPDVPKGPERARVAVDRAEQARRSVLRNGPTWAALTRERDALCWEIRDWRTAIDAARAAIPAARPFMDSLRDAPIDRLSTKLGILLGELGGLINRVAVGDLPLHDAPIVGDLRRLAGLLCDEHQRLKHIAGSEQQPDALEPAARAAEIRAIDRPGRKAAASQPIVNASPMAACSGDPESVTSTGPTVGDLAGEAGVSLETVGRVRHAAGIVVKLRGGAARTRRYTAAEVDQMIEAALAGRFFERKRMASKWAKWGTAEPQLGRE